MQFDHAELEAARAAQVAVEKTARDAERLRDMTILDKAACTIDKAACFEAYKREYTRRGNFPSPLFMTECRSNRVRVSLPDETPTSLPHFRYERYDFGDHSGFVVLLPSYFEK